MRNSNMDTAMLAALSNNIGIFSEAQSEALRNAVRLDWARIGQVLREADRALGIGIRGELQSVAQSLAPRLQQARMALRSFPQPQPPIQCQPIRIVPPLPQPNVVDHLSRRLDQVEAEKAALQAENEKLRQKIHHNETQNPKDLPEHGVDGRFGSPS